MIRLLDAKRRSLPDREERKRQQQAPYVVISHVWEEPEVDYNDMASFEALSASSAWEKAASAAKLEGACRKVLDYFHGSVAYLWLDTVCINKTDPLELSTSINSMYQWYKRAKICFVYLYDYPSQKVTDFTQSRWFTRGWTLQELVAPEKVLFFDRNWRAIGHKETLQVPLTRRTHISKSFLLHIDNIGRASISERMSWFSGRETSVPEDVAYCLLGLFGVNMPLLYGEGRERAFRRLQEEIMRYSDDHSIFAWSSGTATGSSSGLLAPSPDYFRETGKYVHEPSKESDQPFHMTNKGLSIQLPLQKSQGSYVASIDCPHGQGHYLGVYLERLANESQYRRIRLNEMCIVRRGERGNPQKIFVKGLDDL